MLLFILNFLKFIKHHCCISGYLLVKKLYNIKYNNIIKLHIVGNSSSQINHCNNIYISLPFIFIFGVIASCIICKICHIFLTKYKILKSKFVIYMWFEKYTLLWLPLIFLLYSYTCKFKILCPFLSNSLYVSLLVYVVQVVQVIRK